MSRECKCLAACHVENVIGLAMVELRGVASYSRLPDCGIDQTPYCILLLRASQLKEIHSFLEKIYNAFLLADDSGKLSSADVSKKSQSENVDQSGSDSLFSWIYAGSSSGELFPKWSRYKKERTQKGNKILRDIREKLLIIDNSFREKGKLEEQKALQGLEKLFAADTSKRWESNESVCGSYKSALKNRAEILLRENAGCEFEKRAIEDILKAARDDPRLRAIQVCVLETRMLRKFYEFQELKLKLRPFSSLDYRSILLPLMKLYLQALMESSAEITTVSAEDEPYPHSSRSSLEGMTGKKTNQDSEVTSRSEQLETATGFDNESEPEFLPEPPKGDGQADSDDALSYAIDGSWVVFLLIGSLGASSFAETWSDCWEQDTTDTTDGLITSSPKGTTENVYAMDFYGTGLRNYGENNCFLNAVIQSLRHLEQFRHEFLTTAKSDHSHIRDPCVVCALHDILAALRNSSLDTKSEAVTATSLRTALRELQPEDPTFEEKEMGDAAVMWNAILKCLHESCIRRKVSFGPESSDSVLLVSRDYSTAIESAP
ncbi:hypothetical protein AKJ16_DCAP02502 [Drosera capensis]